jgi:hypothetical protein
VFGVETFGAEYEDMLFAGRLDGVEEIFIYFARLVQSRSLRCACNGCASGCGRAGMGLTQPICKNKETPAALKFCNNLLILLTCR